MTDSAPLRVALIGYGFAGKTFHAPLIAATPGLSLHVVASSDPGKVHADLPQARVRPDPLAALADPCVDLAVIATPNHSHAPLAEAALRAGKHVVVDKPFTVELDQARALIQLAQRQRRLLSVFHNRRWDSDFLAVRTAIEQGRLGEVATLESRIDRFRPQVRARWREQAGAATGLWWDLGPHLVDQALLLFGLPDRVGASLAVQRRGGEVADWFQAVLEHGPRRALLQASMLAAGGSARFLVHGERGSALKRRADRQEAQLLAGLRPGAPGWGEDPDPLELHDGNGGVVQAPAPPGDQGRYYAGVRDALLGLAPNPVPPAQALATMAVLVAAERAALSGQAQALPLTAREREDFAASP